ncbi:prepilin-type N-terminal cleavage/methylation domain-containing protein, partial [Lacticaseibacillus rhamnosus]
MRTNEAGFTLIEVLIALVILTVPLMVGPLAGLEVHQA